MKKVGVFFVVATSLYFCLPNAATLSYLTSEKSYTKPISLGTNEDIFEVSSESITLETKVNKKVSVKKEKKEDGTTTESSQVKTSVSLGSQVIFFYPQRQDIFITPKNFKVEGLGKAISVEVAVMPEGNEDGKRGLSFRIAHTMDSVEWETSLKKGVLHIQALGGFYDLKIPIRLATIYNEETTVEEIIVPPDNPPPGGGETPTDPPPTEGGGETPTDPPPTEGGGGETPTDPPPTEDDGGTTTEPPTADGGGSITEPPSVDSTVPVPSGANMVAAEK